MMTRLRAALAAVALLASIPDAACGQVAAASPPPPTARQLELARQILDETGVIANYDEMMRNLFGRIADQTATMMPNGPASATDTAKAVNEAMLASVSKIKPRVVEISVQAYARTFTEEELAGILAFYRTPTGRTMSAKMPQLTRNIGDATTRIMPEIMEVMAKELGQRLPSVEPPSKPMPKTPKT